MSRLDGPKVPRAGSLLVWRTRAINRCLFSAIGRHAGLAKVVLIGSIVEKQWAGAQGLEQGVRKGLVPHLRHKHVCVENHS